MLMASASRPALAHRAKQDRQSAAWSRGKIAREDKFKGSHGPAFLDG